MKKRQSEREKKGSRQEGNRENSRDSVSRPNRLTGEWKKQARGKQLGKKVGKIG